MNSYLTFTVSIDDSTNNSQLTLCKYDNAGEYTVKSERQAGYNFISRNKVIDIPLLEIIGDMATGDNNTIFNAIRSADYNLNKFYFFDVQERISEFIKEGNFSIQAVAEMLGRLSASYGTIQNGKTVYDCDTLSQVAFSIFYYLITHNYKCLTCKHCGKVFFYLTSESSNKHYCHRVSPCFDVILKGKEPARCADAVHRIRANCLSIKHSIDKKAQQTLSYQLKENKWYNNFLKEQNKLYSQQKEFPTVENLTKYYRFLKKVNKEKGWLER